MKIKKDKVLDLVKTRNSFVKSKLRSISLKWKPRNEVFKRARLERGIYKCEECESKVHYKKLEIDHTDPVVPLKGIEKQKSGEIDWNNHIPRLLCGPDNLKALCEKCHSIKTNQENDLRTYYRDKERQKNKTKLKKKNK